MVRIVPIVIIERSLYLADHKLQPGHLNAENHTAGVRGAEQKDQGAAGKVEVSKRRPAHPQIIERRLLQ